MTRSGLFVNVVVSEHQTLEGGLQDVLQDLRNRVGLRMVKRRAHNDEVLGIGSSNDILLEAREFTEREDTFRIREVRNERISLGSNA